MAAAEPGADARDASRAWAIRGALLAAVAVALSLVAARGEPFRLDLPLAAAIQRGAGERLDAFAHAVSWIGLWAPSVAVVGVVAALVWRAGDRVGAGAIIVAALLRPVNGALKRLIDRPRPSADLVRVLEAADGLGFPSGHAFSAMLLAVVAAGVLARTMTGWKLRAAQAACILAALLMGWSRVRLGAHWPGDVLGGWLWGAALGCWVLAALPWIDARRSGGR